MLALAHLPLLVLHGQSLWVREHYQFFPFLLPAAFALAFRNVRVGPTHARPAQRLPYAVRFVLAFLTLGILMLSPWLGAVAAQGDLAGGRVQSRRPTPRRAPAARLVAPVVGDPLAGPARWPVHWRLQRLTSIGASHVLDVAGVLHAREGNVLDLGGHCILVEEACSGVHSLYSVLACTLFWSGWTRRPVGHALLLLLAAFPWVLAGNVARIVTVATLDGVGGVNLSSGWGHEALGFCLFAAMLGLIWSTDHLLLLPTPLSQIPWRQIWRNITTEMVEQQAGDVTKSTLPAQDLAAAAGSEPTRLPPLAATALTPGRSWPVIACWP